MSQKTKRLLFRLNNSQLKTLHYIHSVMAIYITCQLLQCLPNNRRVAIMVVATFFFTIIYRKLNMGLRNKFKTSTDKANKGVEIEFRGKDEINSDGTYPVFTVARQSTQNKKWLADVRSFNEKMYEKHGVTGQEKLTDEEKTTRAIELFCNTVLIGWKDFEAEEDGVKTLFSVQKAIEIFSNTDWNDLYERLSTESGRKENFNIELMDKMSKN